MKTIGVVTVARSDYGIWQPILRRIANEPELRLLLYVGGMHLEEKFGMTADIVEKDGYDICARIPMNMTTDDPAGVASSMGECVRVFCRAFASKRPNILCVLGDRFDMIPAALAAAPFRLPVAHVHGGEITEGAMDDLYRHAMTKLSHLHFASTKEYASRIIQMGEEPWRVTVSGAPGLDQILETQTLPRSELEQRCGIRFDSDPILVTYHPATLDPVPVQDQISSLLEVLAAVNQPLVFTLPNADMGNDAISQAIRTFVDGRDDAVLVNNLGSQAYFSLMNIATAMVGNSSSGIIEAASFDLPVVNIGSRQQGRARNRNVIDCDYQPQSIATAIQKTADASFRDSIKGEQNVYGDGHASELIVNRLLNSEPAETLINKKFFPAKN